MRALLTCLVLPSPYGVPRTVCGVCPPTNPSAKLLSAIEVQLVHEPLTETRNRKLLRPNPIAPWELRVGDLRAFYLRGDFAAAEPLLREALASLCFDRGETATAEVLWSQALAVLRAVRPDGWEVADAESQLGGRLLAQGRRAEAEACLRDGYETRRRLRGEQALRTVQARQRLAELLASPCS